MSTDEQLQILVEDSSVKRNSCKKLLGVKIDSTPYLGNSIYECWKNKTSSKFFFQCTFQLLSLMMDATET